MQGAQIQPLVRELTPNMLHGTAEKKRIKIKVNRRIISPSCTPVDQLEFSQSSSVSLWRLCPTSPFVVFGARRGASFIHILEKGCLE